MTLLLSVEFPSISFREGPQAVIRMAEAIETIGYDALDVFDHVVMGHPREGRPKGPYPATMPILEAIVMLSFAAAVTSRVKLGTEVLVLPQRNPVLLAKQLSTLDTLSGGRVRLGIGVGWQASEFEALDESFSNRGKRNDDAMALMRACWRDEVIDHRSAHYTVDAMAMEPKPPQAERLPIWVGGNSEAAFRRVARLGDGWMASRITDAASAQAAFDSIARHAEAAGRDRSEIGLQSMVAPPPRSDDSKGKQFYAHHDEVVRRVAQLNEMGFQWAALNATAIFQSGARGVDQMIDQLQILHDRIRAEVG